MSNKKPVPRIVVTQTSDFQRLNPSSWDFIVQELKEAIMKDTNNKVIMELIPNE